MDYKNSIQVMIKFIRSFFISFVLALFFLFAGLIYPVPAHAATFQLSGRITDGSGNAIGNTTISVIDVQTNITVNSVVDDASTGNYSLSVPQGIYNITATPDATSGFQSVTQQNQIINSDTVVNFTLVTVTPTPTLYKVSGYLKDSLGNPISNELVVFGAATAGRTDGATGVTDSNGFYSASGLVAPGGVYNFGIAPNSRSDKGFLFGQINLPVSADSNLDIQLPPPHMLTVTVTDALGNPIPNALVTTVGSGTVAVTTSQGGITMNDNGGGNGQDAYTVATNQNGDASFAIEGPTASVHVQSPTSTFLDQNGDTTIDLTQATTTQITLQFSPTPYTISGHLKDSAGNPISNKRITLSAATAGRTDGASGATDGNGFYSASGLVAPGGLYNFGISLNGKDSSFLSGQTNLPVSGNTIFDIQLPPPHPLTVTVVDPLGNPIPNAQVVISGSGPVSVTTSNGNITMNDAPNGVDTYNLTTDSNGIASSNLILGPTASIQVKSPSNTFVDQSGSTNVDLTQNTTAQITLAFAPTQYTISGYLLDSAGNPISNERITLSTATAGRTDGASGATGGNGFYSATGLVAPGGLYNFGISPNGKDSGFLSGQISLQILGNTPFTIQLPPKHRLTITVTDPSGNPVPNANVTVKGSGQVSVATSQGTITMNDVNNGQDTYTSKTDNNGNVSFSIQGPNAEIDVQSPTITLQNVTINLPLTQDTTQVISLQSVSQTLSGVVYNDDNKDGLQDNGENGYQGATVALNTGQTTTTDANGNYSFPNLQPGTYTETLTVPNGYSATTTNPVSLPISANTTQNFGMYSAPVVGTVTVNPNPVQINTAVSATTTFTDSDTTDTHTAKVDWNDGTGQHDCTVNETNKTVSCTLSAGYVAANIYAVTITVSDNDGAQGQSTNPYVSVYAPTPSGKFSAGEGYVTPTNVIAQNPAVLTSTVQFGLVYKYKGTMPTGDKQFTMTFGTSTTTFSASSVTSLVLSNGTGTLTGTGTFSGSNTNYNFLVTGNQNTNTIRIKITDPNNNNAVIYDTQPGSSNTAAPTTSVTGPNGKGNGHVIVG